MSKIIAAAGIRGAHTIVNRAEEDIKRVMDKVGPNHEVAFPNTAYYLPIIYGMLGEKVEKVSDMERVLKVCKSLLPPMVKETCHLPYLAPALDAGMASLFAQEMSEAIKYIETPDIYVQGESPTESNIWLGAADDIILRKRGVEFVDGTAPGFAAIVGAAPTSEIAAQLALEVQQKNLYVFMAADHEGKTFAEQLIEQGVQIGWPTRLVPFGKTISAAVYALGFATRAAMSFGGLEAGDYRKILIYNKDRCYAFVMALGTVTEEWYATALGCVNYGFPTIADTPIPQVLPTGICTYEHVVSNVPHSEMVNKAVEVRGLKVEVSKVDIPLAYGPAFEGERVRGTDIILECGGGKTDMCEYVETKNMNEVEDGKITVVGPNIKDILESDKYKCSKGYSLLPLAIHVEIAGRKMESDYEPILERQVHHLINYAQGLMHIGQRDIAWVRISQQAVDKGFTLEHLGTILHAMYHKEFGAIFDKVQITLYTDQEKVTPILEKARHSYRERDNRVANMKDETTETYYSCTLCQSFAPNHVCVISPERTGLCGSYNWLDCKASNEINPTGPNQPIIKGEVIDQKLGQWKGVNDFVEQASRGNIPYYNFYSIMEQPMTTCGCCECIAAILPMCNGFMTVNRDYTGMTPCGMKFTTLAGTAGGGMSTPGFVGHSKYNIVQKKYLVAEGGLLRMVWMPKQLKEELKELLEARAAELGVPNLLDMIADETVGTTEDEILPWLTEKGHPALTMESMFG